MSQSEGPRLWYPLETVSACLADEETFNLRNCFSTVLDEADRCWQLREFCTPFLIAVQLPENHFQVLDAQLKTLIPGAFNHHFSSLPNTTFPHGKDIRQVGDILRRLPRLPQRLFALPLANTGAEGTLWNGIKDGEWAKKFVLPDAPLRKELPDSNDADSILNQLRNMQDMVWENLYVTTFIDTNSVVLAVRIAQEGAMANFAFAREFLQYVNVLADLVNEFEHLDNAARLCFTQAFSDPAPSVQALRRALFPDINGGHEQGRDIIRIFLWAAWQRSVMLFFYYILKVQLRQGHSPEWSSLFAVQGIRRLEELHQEYYRGEGIDYMCNWAFQILRTSRSSLGLDFRTMLSRFDSHFGDHTGRCLKESDLTCQSDVPDSCQRFTGAETKSQSKHTSSCNRFCDNIKWSEESYKNLTGARAVKFESNSSCLEYCQASARTMAISHVWSHGQGGRPEHGINLCLHRQYSALARACGCDSYWIDSTCIPSETELRREAIETINTVFTTSKVVLISDLDLESVVISSTNIEQLETLFSILLVCDWNVRAWTMLEAIRGRSNVHILGKASQMISLVDLFREVLDRGAIDLAVLLGGAQHLLPSDPSAAISVEDAGFLLSQRHASRPADEVVIWGLLNSLSGDKSALNLWKSQKSVRTGFLLSSAARIESPGYRWAPKEPYIRPQLRNVMLDKDSSSSAEQQHYMVCYQAYDGQGSYIAKIGVASLESKWLVQDVDAGFLVNYRKDYCYKTPLGAGHPTQQYLNPDIDEMVEVHEQPDTALACAIIEDILTGGNQARLVRPLAECGTIPYKGGTNRGELYGTIAALCLLRPGNDTWEWLGVYQWLGESDDRRWGIEFMVIK